MNIELIENLRDLMVSLTISLETKAKVVIPAPNAPALFLI
jgi:hypothetical protein